MKKFEIKQIPNRRNYFLGIFINILVGLTVVMVGSCTTKYSPGTDTPQLLNNNSSTDISPVATPSNMAVFPSKTSTLASSTKTETPNIVKLCPINPKVSSNQMNFTTEDRLVLKGNDSLILLDPNTNTSSNLSIHPENSVMSSPFWFQVSPNRKWIAYYARNISKDEQNPFDLWVISMDGLISRRVAESLPRYSTIRWDQSDIITVWLSEPDINSCSRPIIQINPFIGIFDQLTPHYPEADWPNCQISIDSKWVSPDYSKYIYYDNGWKIFEYPSGNTLEAFPWLPKEGMAYSGKLDIKWTERGISLLLPASNNINNFQFVLNLHQEKIFDQNVSLTEVNIEQFRLNFSRIRENVIWWSDDGFQIAMNLRTGEEPVDGNTSEKYFSIFDLSNNKLLIYCFDRANASNRLFQSPNGQLLAWTEYQNSSGTTPQSIVILDKTSGVLAEIESEFELIGWGLIDQP